MSKSNPLPELAGISKIIFMTEGNPTALMITNRAGQRSQTALAFATAEAALGYCRDHSAMLVYCPVDLDRN